jgi:hypothetical protein
MYGVTPQGIRDAAFGIDIPAGDVVDGQLTRLIEKAETRLNAVIPTLAGRYESGAVTEALIGGVVEDMVLRVARNPQALRSFGIDDFQAVLDNSVSTGLLRVDPSEFDLLAPGSGRPRVGSIILGVPSWRMPHGC